MHITHLHAMYIPPMGVIGCFSIYSVSFYLYICMKGRGMDKSEGVLRPVMRPSRDPEIPPLTFSNHPV